MPCGRRLAVIVRGLRDRLTYANVAATLALFLALAGGVAWALEQNSVRSEHIRNGEVQVRDTQPGALGRGVQLGATSELLQGTGTNRYFPVGYTTEPLGGGASAQGAPAPVPLRLDDLRVELPGTVNDGSVTFTLGDPGSATKQLSCTIDAEDDTLVCRDSEPAIEKLFRGDAVQLSVTRSQIELAGTGMTWSFRTTTP